MENLWERYNLSNHPGRTPCILSLHFDKGIDPRLKKQYKKLAKWLRKTYFFPASLNVYVINAETVTLRSGCPAYGSFRWFPERPPRIKIPSAKEELQKQGLSDEEINEMILSSFIHELTHYFQWADGNNQTNAISERQANYFRYRILEKYCSAEK